MKAPAEADASFSTQWDIILGTRMTRAEADVKANRKLAREKERAKLE